MKTIANMILFATLLCNAAFSQSKFETIVTFEQSEVITATSASIEPQSDRVDVFLTDPSKDRALCLQVIVKSQAKFVAVRARSTTQPVTVNQRQNGSHYFLGGPGKYEISVIEFDPEKGIQFTDYVREIKGIEPPPPPPPPISNFDDLKRVAFEKVKSLNDPKTATALSIAYRNAVSQMPGKTKDECVEIAKAARRTALLGRTGSSLLVDWKSFLEAVDVEMLKVASTADQYGEACLAIADAIK